MNNLYLPISSFEARTLHKEKKLIKLKSWTDRWEEVPESVTPDYFDEGYFGISLSDEEAKPFLNLHKKFAWTIIGAGGTLPTALILNALAFLPHPQNLDFNYLMYRVIGLILLSIGLYSLYHMWDQAKEETRLWHKLFDKYQVSAWKNSWR